jgi:class 3 adenylate cyclase
MGDLLNNALQIAQLMYDRGYVGAKTITVGELRTQIDISREDFDNADIYLLESRYCDGTMGGDLGQRRLTADGVNFVGARNKQVAPTSDEVVTPVSVVREEAELAHVLYIDIVGFSKLRLKDQQEVHQQLTKLVQEIGEVGRSKRQGDLITLPTGDGVALVFFKGLRRHVDAAIELSKKLEDQSSMKVRMGIHTGPVQRVVDVNERLNVVGPGINIAQRVMDCGDADHILLSKELAEILLELGDFDELLEDLGLTQVKHGKHVHLYNLRGEGFGNSNRPSKLRSTGEDLDEVSEGSSPSAATVGNDFLPVLLSASDGRAIIVPAERVVQGETLTLTLLPADQGDLSFLRGLRSKPSDVIGIAYGNTGMHARVKSVSSILEHGKHVWTVEVQPFERDYRGGGLGEMACGNFSADDIAVLRARRILLDEELPGYSTAEDETSQQLNNAMLEAFVQGINTQVKIKRSMIPILFQGSAGDITGFLVAARLFSVLWLHVSGVIDHINELEMKMVGKSNLAVKFEGRRPRTYVNVEPTVIKVEGIFNLAKDAY